MVCVISSTTESEKLGAAAVGKLWLYTDTLR